MQMLKKNCKIAKFGHSNTDFQRILNFVSLLLKYSIIRNLDLYIYGVAV